MRQVSLKESTEAEYPELPKYQGDWCPVYWEPIMLSGERLCSIIAAVGLDGSVLVEPVLRSNVLKQLYRERYADAESILRWVADSLRNFLLAGGDFSDWEVPMSGFSVGNTYSSLADDLKGIVVNAIPFCASLSSVDLLDRTEPSKGAEMSRDRWRHSIRDKVVSQLPRLKESFNRTFTVVQGARQTEIDFVGQKLASNFSRLVSSQLSRCVKDAKSQVLDLVALREKIYMFPQDEQYQLLVWRPGPESGQELSEYQLKLVDEAFLELEGEGDRFDLRVKGYSSADLAANSICQIEVAV